MSLPENVVAALAARGFSVEDAVWWASREEFERQEWAKEQGACCWAGLAAAPGPCLWHP